MTARYRNPWYNPDDRHSGPAYFETEIQPTKHAGMLIYHRERLVWDVVRNGVCIAQRAGLIGAKTAAESYAAKPQKVE